MPASFSLASWHGHISTGTPPCTKSPAPSSRTDATWNCTSCRCWAACRLRASLREVLSRFHGDRRSAPANANRCLALVSHIFTMAEKWGMTAPGTNPCRGLTRYREVARERYLSADELARLGGVLAAAQKRPDEDWRAVSALCLLLFTGARLSEVLTLEWRFINWEAGFARLPDSKTGARTLTLPDPALQLLRQVQHDHPDSSPFVFPGKRKGTWFTGIQKPWQKLRRDAGLEDVRIHDLRHSFASLAVANGESLYLVGPCPRTPACHYHPALRACGGNPHAGCRKPHGRASRSAIDEGSIRS